MAVRKKAECFISVDVETAGPIPVEFSLLTIGACVVEDDTKAFTCKIKPITRKADPKALSISGLSLDDLERDGLEPAEAMRQFHAWVQSVADGAIPVFVGLNAAFDWSFVNYYFHRYLGINPFGFAPLDIKSLYMGATGCAWDGTRSSQMIAVLQPKSCGDHDALNDARAQAELFRLVRRLRDSGRSTFTVVEK